MLISFSVENFKSFRDRTVLRMDCSADTDLPNVVRHDVPGADVYRGMLTVASIHGANASGKTNLIRIADILDDYVNMALRFPEGRIPDDYPLSYHPGRSIDPFRLSRRSLSLPTKIEIAFLISGIRWMYGIATDGNTIHSEQLYHWQNGRRTPVFVRGAAVEPDEVALQLDRTVLDDDGVKDPPGTRTIPTLDPERWKHGIAKHASAAQENWKFGRDFEKGDTEGRALAGRTRPSVPFLSVAASWNHPQAMQVINWFRRFTIMDATQPPFRMTDSTSRACNSDPAVRDWAERWMRAADFGISSISVSKDENAQAAGGRPSTSYTTRAMHVDSEGNQVPFGMHQESHGTNRLFAMSHTLYRILQTGGVMLVDELHSGLHPLLLRALIKLFQSKERNPQNAQLIFTTHDVSILDNSLLRRDQIHIVEKSNDGSSELYNLSESDFKPRKDAPLVKYYLAGHLGGVPDLDIDAIFQPMMTDADQSGQGLEQ